MKALLLPLLLLAACGSTPPATSSASPARATPAPPAASSAPAPATVRCTPSADASTGYTLVLIRTGPKSGALPAEENQRAFAGHFENMERMAKAGQLVLAGPYGESRHAPDLRGIFVLDTADRAQAEAWAGTDPTTRAGVFRLEFHDLATEAALRRALAEDLAWHEREVAEGKTPSPGENARGYVLLTAEQGDLARRELAPLQTTEGGVLFLAQLDGTRALALLDAANAAEARERFGPQLEELGACTLDDWFGSSQFARLPELSGR
jgi:uncharacterized protein YciI